MYVYSYFIYVLQLGGDIPSKKGLTIIFHCKHFTVTASICIIYAFVFISLQIQMLGLIRRVIVSELPPEITAIVNVSIL